MQTDHSRQMAEVERKHRREIANKEAKHKEEISFLKTVIAKAAWFPYFREMLRIENFCRLVGFSDGQTATLVKGKPLEYVGELYSEEHNRKFKTGKAGVQVMKDPHRWDETGSCHQQKAHRRVGQRVIRQTKVNYTITKSAINKRFSISIIK